jgi:hypothetical protein
MANQAVQVHSSNLWHLIFIPPTQPLPGLPGQPEGTLVIARSAFPVIFSRLVGRPRAGPDTRNDGHQVSVMTDLLPVWIKNLTAVEQRLLAVLLLLAALLVLLHLVRAPLRDWRERRQIRRTVRQLGARILRDITLADGMGGDIHIDYLALCSDAILVIDVKRYDGMIFGSTKTDEWTQTLNSRSYKFPNPEIHLARQISAIRNIIPKTPVSGLHLFTDTALFPWDKPPNVLQLKDLRNSSSHRPAIKDIPAELRTAWAQIIQAIQH